MRRGPLLFVAALVAACQMPGAASAEGVVNAPVAVRRAVEPGGLQTALFAGGCYWGVEGVFSHVVGVTSAVAGFHGGSSANANYERVSEGDTGHAESVRVTYDPTKIRYDQLLRIYFSVVADPTELDRQGPDSGTQYRSALIPLTTEQRAVATAYLAQLRGSRLWQAPIVTRVEGYRRFYPAAPDHQDFMQKNPAHPYIRRWDAPKVAALRQLYPSVYQAGFTPR